MKKTKPKVLVFDCITVYHSSTIYDALKDAVGRPVDVEGGYQPSSHDMPTELINDRFKENTRVAFQKLRKTRGTMKSLQTVIKSEAKNLTFSSFVTALVIC